MSVAVVVVVIVRGAVSDRHEDLATPVVMWKYKNLPLQVAHLLVDIDAWGGN